MRRFYPYCMILMISLVMMCGGCSDVKEPLNLEPSLKVGDAHDVTRNEAVLSAEIITRGEGKLSYVHFSYGEEGKTFTKTVDIENPSGIVEVGISGLKPGTRYNYYVEGGNRSAVIRSETASFTTIPNEIPSISDIEIIASGPTAVVVEFSILEDGGETILEAGCELRDKNNNSSILYYADSADLKVGTVRFLIHSLTPLSEYTLVAVCRNSVGEARGEAVGFVTRETVQLNNPGHLSELLGKNDYPSATLNISGSMNGDDFHMLRRLLGCPPLPGEEKIEGGVESVDLTDVALVEGGGSYDGSRYISEGIISTGLFSDCGNLTEILLPFSVTAIERDAFSGCLNLHILSVPPSVETLSPSSGCGRLECIEVSQGNRYYRSIDGVLFNNAGTEIVWFPLGKSGDYSLPETVTAIGENAFRDTGITSLSIPESVEKISRGAFSGSALQEITLPDNLTNLSEGIFQNCRNLKVVRIGRGTEFLGNYLFDGCPLEHLYITSELPPYVSADTFKNSESLFGSCILHVPAGMKGVYRNHSQFGKFNIITEIGDE